jgi:hypothetical protein
MEISLYPPMLPTRPCAFCISLDGGSIFADFDIDARDHRVYAVRVSFDGYGCYDAPETIGRMNADDSRALCTIVETGALDERAEAILRRYFASVAELPWAEPLRRYGLIA